MPNQTSRSSREGLMLLALVSGALYCTLLGHVFNYRGQGAMALASALAAIALVVPIYRSVYHA